MSGMPKQEEFLYSKSTDKTIDVVAEALRKVIPEHKFGLLHEYDFKKKLASKGIEHEQEVRCFEVCSPSKAHTVLTTNVHVSCMLPCRISFFATENGTTVETVKPTILIGMFNQGDVLKPVAESVEETLCKIIDAATA
jgi:uncharacterized protein (DUF302 family)